MPPTTRRRARQGAFFDDYCNWQRIPEFAEVIHSSRRRTGRRGADAKPKCPAFPRSRAGQGTGHLDGHALAPGRALLLRRRAHRPSASGPRLTRCARRRCAASRDRTSGRSRCCRRAGSRAIAFFDPAPYMPVPDPEAEGMEIREWQMEPGDAVAFNLSASCTARAATPQRPPPRLFAAPWSGTTRATSRAPARPRRPFRGTRWCRANAARGLVSDAARVALRTVRCWTGRSLPSRD